MTRLQMLFISVITLAFFAGTRSSAADRSAAQERTSVQQNNADAYARLMNQARIAGAKCNFDEAISLYCSALDLDKARSQDDENEAVN